jgi:hypothetical protein
LYIDDDFGQDLGANMELFEENDVDDVDFGEIFTTEIFQQDEMEEEFNDPDKLKELEPPREKAAIEPPPVVATKANDTNNLISF